MAVRQNVMTCMVAATGMLASLVMAAAPAPTAPDCASTDQSVPLFADGCPAWSSQLALAQSYAGFTSDPAIHRASTPVATSVDGAVTVVTRPVDAGEAHDWQTTALDTDTGEELWTSGLSHARYDVPVTVSVTGGSALVTGMVDYPDTPNTLYVNICAPYDAALPATVAYDITTGAERWRHVGTRRGVTLGHTVSPDGRTLYTTGAVHTEGTETCDLDVLVEAHDVATGERRWTTSTTLSGTGADRATGIHWTPYGLVVTGSSIADARSSREAFALGVDPADGSVRWSTAIAPSEFSEELHDAALSPDGRTLYVAGRGLNATGSLFSNNTLNGTILLTDSDYIAAALDTATGQVRWSTRYDSGTPGPDDALAIAVSPDGTQVALTGQVAGTADVELDMATVGMDAQSGDQLWVHTVSDPAQNVEIGQDVSFAPDGTVLAIGTLDASGLPGRSVLVRVAADGTELRSTRFTIEPSRDEDVAKLVLTPSANDVLVVGRTFDELTAGSGLPDDSSPTGPDTLGVWSFPVA